MAKGELAIVLHAHLPYVRSAKAGSLEEDWFFQALMECYLPLLEILEVSKAAKEQNPKITIGLSPTLLSLLDDPELKQRFPAWIRRRMCLLEELPQELKNAGSHLLEKIKHQLRNWQSCNGEVIKRFSNLQKAGVVDLLTCAATHGYLPLLRENPESVRGQLRTAVREHLRLLGERPLGIWLPECAYYEGLDRLMLEAGLRYAVLDGHGILHAKPRPRYGIYSPICSKNGIAFFGRDSESTLPVWSAKQGYPGNSSYREFHKDLGWDLPLERLKEIGVLDRRPLGLKLHRVTGLNCPLDKKEIYDPKIANIRIKEHAKDYLKSRRLEMARIKTTMGKKPLLTAPFDAELFGHWWFEGPEFLAELFTQNNNEEINFTHLREQLSSSSKLQLCEPSPSSWGQGGYHNYWLNDTNDWLIKKWSKASKAMIKFSSIEMKDPHHQRMLKQAGKELLLAQSSDWSFILRAGTTTDLAKERINLHLNRFWKLIKTIEEKEELSIDFLDYIEKEDSLFPLIQTKDWAKS